MKNLVYLFIGTVLLIDTSALWAGEAHKNYTQSAESATEKPATEIKATAAAEVGNKICPVSGEKIGKMGEPVKYEHNGRIYNFCCPMCVKDFKKNPEKYIKILEEKGDMNTANPAEEGKGHDHQHK